MGILIGFSRSNRARFFQEWQLSDVCQLPGCLCCISINQHEAVFINARTIGYVVHKLFWKDLLMGAGHHHVEALSSLRVPTNMWSVIYDLYGRGPASERHAQGK